MAMGSFKMTESIFYGILRKKKLQCKTTQVFMTTLSFFFNISIIHEDNIFTVTIIFYHKMLTL